MAIQRVEVTRASWLFAQQCAAAGIPALTGGGTTNRYTGAAIPRCVALSVAAESEVRAIRVSAPGAPFASMVQVIEGAPQAFRWDGGAVDIARLDWTDGRLVLECAETVEDIPGLSVLIETTPHITLAGTVADASGLIAYIEAPRLALGILTVVGHVGRVGGVGSGLTSTPVQKSPDGLSVNACAPVGTSCITTIAATPGGFVGSPLPLPAVCRGHAVRVSIGADAGAVYHGVYYIRGA